MYQSDFNSDCHITSTDYVENLPLFLHHKEVHKYKSKKKEKKKKFITIGKKLTTFPYKNRKKKSLKGVTCQKYIKLYGE